MGLGGILPQIIFVSIILLFVIPTPAYLVETKEIGKDSLRLILGLIATSLGFLGIYGSKLLVKKNSKGILIWTTLLIFSWGVFIWNITYHLMGSGLDLATKMGSVIFDIIPMIFTLVITGYLYKIIKTGNQ